MISEEDARRLQAELLTQSPRTPRRTTSIGGLSAGSSMGTPDPRNTDDVGPLLPPQSPQDMGKKCLVIDLDETLVHSEMKVRFSVPLLVKITLRCPGGVFS